MADPIKTHWKKLVNPDYLGSYSFQPGEEKTLTIKNVKTEHVKGPDGKGSECTVCHFVENEKPMILNRTNCKIISKIHGSSFIEDWSGKKVQIHVEPVKAFGEVVDGLKIRAYIPAEGRLLPELTEDHASWPKVKEHMESGGTIEGVEKKFRLSDEIRNKLLGNAQ